jgi:hypothetical protein
MILPALEVARERARDLDGRVVARLSPPELPERASPNHAEEMFRLATGYGHPPPESLWLRDEDSFDCVAACMPLSEEGFIVRVEKGTIADAYATWTSSSNDLPTIVALFRRERAFDPGRANPTLPFPARAITASWFIDGHFSRPNGKPVAFTDFHTSRAAWAEWQHLEAEQTDYEDA